MTATVDAVTPRMRRFRVVPTFRHPDHVDVEVVEVVEAVDWSFGEGLFRFHTADAWITAAFPAANVFAVRDLGSVGP